MINYDEFESLTPEQQQKVILESPVREKGDLILHAHEPGPLTRSLAVEELYLITREMDIEERSEIIRHATLSQLFFMADMDCWDKDQISPLGFVTWLETLRLADERHLYAWLHEMDYETIVAGFQKFVSVIKPQWEYAVDEVLGDRPYFTLDQMYYIMVDEANFDTVKRTFEVLFENHRGRYAAILEGILGESEYEVEEEAYRFRTGRLADRGFPDFETSRSVYVPLDRQAFEQFEKKRQGFAGREQRDSGRARPHYLAIRSPRQLFLDRAMAVFAEKAPSLAEEAYEEFAWLSNKLIVCHGMDFTSEEKVKWAVERTRSLLSFGLEILSEGDLEKASRILQDRWIETVFRYGIGELERLREKSASLASLYWKGSGEILLDFLDPPYEFIVKGLLEKPPLFYDFEVTENVYSLREFQTAADRDRSLLSIEQMEAIHLFLAEKIPGVFVKVREEHASGGVSGTFFSVLGTVFAQFVLRGRPAMDALQPSELRKFLEKAFEPSQAGARIIKTEWKEKFLCSFFDGPEQDLLRPLWGFVFQKIQEQMMRLEPSEEIETTLLTAVLVKHGQVSQGSARRRGSEKKALKRKAGRK